MLSASLYAQTKLDLCCLSSSGKEISLRGLAYTSQVGRETFWSCLPFFSSLPSKKGFKNAFNAHVRQIFSVTKWLMMPLSNEVPVAPGQLEFVGGVMSTQDLI